MPVLGSFWPENCGIGYNFTAKFLWLGCAFTWNFLGLGFTFILKILVMGAE